MTMTTTQSIIIIVCVVLGTMVTRFLPFLIFPEGKEPPEFILHLGKVLPYAVIGLLIIYCLKDVSTSGTYGLPEAIAILFIVFLEKTHPPKHRRRNSVVYASCTDGVLNLLFSALKEFLLVR